jgi:hypothetical protein
MDWPAIFGFEMNPWELVLRGTVMYWFVYLLFRFVLRRDVGSIAIADILLLVLIADAAQNAMGGNSTTVPEGALLVATIAGWNYALDWASYRVAFIHRLAEPPPLPLIRHGRVLRANLRHEMLTLDDLRQASRAGRRRRGSGESGVHGIRRHDQRRALRWRRAAGAAASAALTAGLNRWLLPRTHDHVVAHVDHVRHRARDLRGAQALGFAGGKA